VSREVKRSARVAEQLRQELSVMLRGLGDPRARGAIVTRVELTDDLSFARIFVRSDVGADPRTLVRGLESASGKLRGELTRRLGLRVAPGLRFLYDEGVDAQARVEELLREIDAEKGSTSSSR
jgi:ribosome-binding factor A